MNDVKVMNHCTLKKKNIKAKLRNLSTQKFLILLITNILFLQHTCVIKEKLRDMFD